LYSYKSAASGFSAKLTPDQVAQISSKFFFVFSIPFWIIIIFYVFQIILFNVFSSKADQDKKKFAFYVSDHLVNLKCEFFSYKFNESKKQTFSLLIRTRRSIIVDVLFQIFFMTDCSFDVIYLCVRFIKCFCWKSI
jgi:hypothetical protein